MTHLVKSDYDTEKRIEEDDNYKSLKVVVYTNIDKNATAESIKPLASFLIQAAGERAMRATAKLLEEHYGVTVENNSSD